MGNVLQLSPIVLVCLLLVFIISLARKIIFLSQFSTYPSHLKIAFHFYVVLPEYLSSSKYHLKFQVKLLLHST